MRACCLCRFLVLGQRGRSNTSSHVPALIGSFMMLIFYMYIYLTKTSLDIFNCNSTTPPDGNTYVSCPEFDPSCRAAHECSAGPQSLRPCYTVATSLRQPGPACASAGRCQPLRQATSAQHSPLSPTLCLQVPGSGVCAVQQARWYAAAAAALRHCVFHVVHCGISSHPGPGAHQVQEADLRRPGKNLPPTIPRST